MEDQKYYFMAVVSQKTPQNGHFTTTKIDQVLDIRSFSEILRVNLVQNWTLSHSTHHDEHINPETEVRKCPGEI